MSLEIKSLPSLESVKQLYVRALARETTNGRFDIEVLVLDIDKKLIDMSH